MNTISPRISESSSSAYAAQPDLAAQIDFLIHRHLARLLKLGESASDFVPVLEFLAAATKVGPPATWAQETFLESYCVAMDLDYGAATTKLLRDFPVIPVDPTLVGVFPALVRIPPLCTPLLPLAFRLGEVTVASSIPQLDQLLNSEPFQWLNHFWGVKSINVVWAEAALIRDRLSQLSDRISLEPATGQADGPTINGGTPWLDLECFSVSDRLNQWFNPVLQRRYQAAPVYSGKRQMTLAVVRSFDPHTKAEIEGALRHRFGIQQALADPAALLRFISACESKAINTTGIVKGIGSLDRAGRQSDHPEVIYADRLHQSPAGGKSDEQAVVKFVHSILYKGIDLRASDIMFQEFPQKLRVRYKVDGDWFDENGEFPGYIARQVISRIKVISGLEIQYVRTPQDGTFPIKIGDQRYDFRVNTSYQAQGEQAVLRLQRDQRSVRTLGELGMPERYIDAVNDLMNGDHGLLILCGPTGSGKTTTIYSILRSVDAVKHNVLTAESPIEVYLENISQTQIDDDGPYSYATWARGILRQAPDIVMMGEIRDEESVEALMRLSSSGHRAISTLHTNSVCEVPNRFTLFHAQPFMVADSLKLAISQRLVKKVCPRCYLEEPVPAPEKLQRLGINPAWLEGVRQIRRGRRCEFCRHTGVSGRKAIFEVLLVDDEIRLAVQERAPTVEMRCLMERKGEKTLFEKAVQEVAAGLISLEEACKFREISTVG